VERIVELGLLLQEHVEKLNTLISVRAKPP